jgi:hypothetical protein
MAGFDVESLTFNNSDFVSMKFPRALYCLWNPEAAREVYDIAVKFGADAVHVHNTFPFVSPSVIFAAKKAGATTIQWLHNYRLLVRGRDAHC